MGAWCLCLIVSFANGDVEHGSCTGGNCEVSDSTVLFQNGLGMVDDTETASEEGAEAQGDDDDDDNDGSSGDGDTNVACSSFTTGSTCRSNGCSWSGAFVGEKKADGSELTGYICADDEEVEEEVHDKLMNGTGFLIQMLEDESEITSKGNEQRWCRRRRAGGGGCPYCRRRRSPPPPPAKVEANGCPTGLQPNSNGKCPGSGQCCTTGWSASCNQACATQRCTSTGGSWIPLNYASNAYTCEMPVPPTNPSTYSDEPKADNGGFDCLCAAGTGFCGAANTWYGTLAVAKTKCDGNAECQYLHDWKADGTNWRACRTITSPGDGKAAIKKKSSSNSVNTNTPLFDRIDADKSESISNAEFIKALADGVILPCVWSSHANKYSGGYAGVPTMYTSQKKAKDACIALDADKCKAITCNAAGTACRTGASSALSNSPGGEITYVPSAICFSKSLPATTPSPPAPLPATTPSPPPGPASAIFDRVDENNNNAITADEFSKAVAAGTITTQN